MSPGPVFVALVNPKSGGNVGSTLLARFKEILDSSRVYNLAEEGPKRALEEHWGKPNLRIIGRRRSFQVSSFCPVHFAKKRTNGIYCVN